MTDQADTGKPESPQARTKKSAAAKKRKRTRSATKKSGKKRGNSAASSAAKYPRHTVEKALRIPKAIIDQNAGRECTERESAQYVGVGFNGPYRVEVSSALKYGFLQRERAGVIAVTDRARQAIRPQRPEDHVTALREAILAAPMFSDVYLHYRGEYLPDGAFFENALVDKFSIPSEKVREFIELFLASLQSAQLVEEKDDKYHILNVSGASEQKEAGTIRKLSAEANPDHALARIMH